MTMVIVSKLLSLANITQPTTMIDVLIPLVFGSTLNKCLTFKITFFYLEKSLKAIVNGTKIGSEGQYYCYINLATSCRSAIAYCSGVCYC